MTDNSIKNLGEAVEVVRNFRDENLPNSSIVTLDDPKYPNHRVIHLTENLGLPENSKSSLEILGFSPTGRTPRRGSWGIVDEYVDGQGQIWAIKRLSPNQTAQRQMQERNLSLIEVLQNEAIPLQASQHNIVPRIVGSDFVAMPFYEHTLKDYLEEKASSEIESRYFNDHNIRIARGILRGLNYFHTELGKAHPDLKPTNIMIDSSGEALLTDFGNVTYASESEQSDSPRDNIGNIETRAYECFRKESHPDKRSNVWGAGALIGQLFTGETPFGKRLANSLDPSQEMSNVGESEANGRINDYLRSSKIPKPIRKVLRKALDYNPKLRYKDAGEFQEAFEKAVKKYQEGKFGTVKYLVAASVVGLAVATGGLFIAQGLLGDLEKKVAEQEQTIELDGKLRIANLYLQKEELGKKPDEHRTCSADYEEEGKLIGWIKQFDNTRIGIAAYLDPLWVHRSVRENNGKTDYTSLWDVLERNNQKLAWKVEGMTSILWRYPNGPNSDMALCDRRDKNKQEAKQVWQELDRDYQRYQELEKWEVEAFRRCKSELTLKPRGFEFSSNLDPNSYYFRNYVKGKGDSDKYEDLQKLREKFKVNLGGKEK